MTARCAAEAEELRAKAKRLLEYAEGKTQTTVLESLARTGSPTATAKELKRHRTCIQKTVQRVAARAVVRGHAPEHDRNHPIPAPEVLKGNSILYKGDGSVSLHWVKTHLPIEKAWEALRATVEELSEDVRGVAKPVRQTRGVGAPDDLLNVVVVGDAHFGSLVWGEEVGEDFDLSIASRRNVGAVRLLIDRMPPAAEAWLWVTGDFFHFDNYAGTTEKSGNILDTDGRFPKMVRTGVAALKEQVHLLLKTHAKVKVVYVPGNHDPKLAILVSMLLEEHYAREPRVEIDSDVTQHRGFRWGKTFIGGDHGDRLPMKRILGVAMRKFGRLMAPCTYRTWIRGHKHSREVQDLGGLIAEHFECLAATDAWHDKEGYHGANQTMAGLTFSKDGEEVCRHTVSKRLIDQMEATK